MVTRYSVYHFYAPLSAKVVVKYRITFRNKRRCSLTTLTGHKTLISYKNYRTEAIEEYVIRYKNSRAETIVECFEVSKLEVQLYMGNGNWV